MENFLKKHCIMQDKHLHSYNANIYKLDNKDLNNIIDLSSNTCSISLLQSVIILIIFIRYYHSSSTGIGIYNHLLSDAFNCFIVEKVQI